MDAEIGPADIARLWQQRLGGAWRWSRAAALLVTGIAAVLIARQGTLGTRLAALGLVVGCASAIVGISIWRARRERDVMGEAVRVVRRVDPELAAELRRAEHLVQTTQRSQYLSVELAQLHLSRILERVPTQPIEALAASRATLLGFSSKAVVLATLLATLVLPVRLIEGLDVFLARHGVGAWQLRLLELDTVAVQPPAYLRTTNTAVEFEGTAEQPRGSLIVVHATPMHGGRHYVLTDGRREVPFVSDGQGGVLARYVLEDSARLRVAARFGAVLLLQKDELVLEAIVDQPPRIELDGAPRRISMTERSELELNYQVYDDHGIRQIDLVLRSGGRESTRTLGRLDGETERQSGIHVLSFDDEFIEDCFGPVEVLVAARDDNNLDRPSWGYSPAFTLERPSLGGAQVRRREAYLGVRDALVDWLAATEQAPRDTAKLKDLRARALERLSEMEAAPVSEASLRRTIGAFFRAQREKLARAGQDARPPSDVLAEVTLSVDAAMEAIARRDAEQVARQLSDLAVEIESSAKAASHGERREESLSRVEVAHAALRAGAAELKRLGRLGADLGEIATAGWGRIERAKTARDFENVERAASFLAERLRRPRPSFVGGGRPGVESMGHPSSRAAGPRASDADSHLERVAAELQQLVREHASEIESVERSVDAGDKTKAPEDLRPTAHQHADELRRLVDGLPPLGAEPGTQRATLGLAKEVIRGAADSLDRLELSSAYEDLQRAEATLLEAELLHDATSPMSGEFGKARLEELRRRLTEHREWIDSVLGQGRERNSDESRDALRRSALREREMGERARRLSQREASEDAVLPDALRADLEQAARLMRRASEMLDRGRGQPGLEQQRQAQNLLERNGPDARAPDQTPNGEPREGRDGNGRASRGNKVVSTSDVESREAFRRRVQKGLSRETTPELAPKVRRYAEGLLK